MAAGIRDAPALIAAVTALISPAKEVYNYYFTSIRTLVGYGKGAAAVMTYLDNDKKASRIRLRGCICTQVIHTVRSTLTVNMSAR